MSCPTTIQQAVASLVGCKPHGDGYLVHTTCLYPSNDAVRVLVRGGKDQFVVSDNGGAIAALEDAGLEQAGGDRFLHKYARAQGLRVERGAIISPPVNAENLPVAILLVANASQEAAHRELEHRKMRPARDFKQMLENILWQRFPNRTEKDRLFLGESNRQYKFDYTVKAESGKLLLLDAVTPDYSSIASRVLANLDVRNRGDEGIVQRIVYDDRFPWKAEDILLLENGAPTVPYSALSQSLDRLAA
ncbi:hypothetical protein FZ983_30455 [Azospirillum sp. B21]|uniref:hypothetical protein n=1 Tax=Azospirillum sp. B21 TaxID=2607496 RepID=UPI0011EEBB09|nr:hypothetical protein [Azospirillum sp. B21]KAA0573337.1 hypothetical protein FZ983_30455 [Azospirillum sp. B21]